MTKNKTTLALTVLIGSVGAALATRALSRDSTLALLFEGYTFIPKRCQRYRSDIFETRLMLTGFGVLGNQASRIDYSRNP